MKNNFSRRDISILIANCIDHFDTALYGFLAPIMAPHFFPNKDPIISIILAYSVLGTSVITRIVGSYIFGRIAINYSNIISLSYSLIGVAIFTMFMGVLPSYQHIGIAAPILLVVLRVLRGICAAGESTMAKLYIIENKTDRQAFRLSHLYQTSTMMGIVLASFASTYVIFSESYHLWRVCYILGGSVGIFGIYLRKFDKLKEKPNLKKTFDNFFDSFYLMFRKDKILLLKLSSVYAFSYLTYSTPFILMNSLVPLISDLTLEDMMKINSGLLVFDLIALPLIGFYIEKYNPHNVMILAASILGLTIPVLWHFLENANFYYVLMVRGWIVLWGVIFACPFNLWCYKQTINNKNRYIIVGAAASVGTGFIGKMNPAIGLFIFHYFGNYQYTGLYLSVIMLLTAYIIFKSKPSNLNSPLKSH